MGAPTAVSLSTVLGAAQRDAHAHGLAAGGDPLRLQLPPDSVTEDSLDPAAAAVLGSLYLLSELEACGVVECAALLAEQRWELGVRDTITHHRLEAYAEFSEKWPRPAMREQLYARLFGTPAEPPVATTNEVFEELLAGYCDALAGFDPGRLPRAGNDLRLAGDRLRSNLAPRQYGNTLIIARSLVDQLRASLDLLALRGIGLVFQVEGAWDVVRAMQPDAAIDIGRHVDRGQSGRTLVSSLGHPTPRGAVEPDLVQAADTWLTATGFEARFEAGPSAYDDRAGPR